MFHVGILRVLVKHPLDETEQDQRAVLRCHQMEMQSVPVQQQPEESVAIIPVERVPVRGDRHIRLLAHLAFSTSPLAQWAALRFS